MLVDLLSPRVASAAGVAALLVFATPTSGADEGAEAGNQASPAPDARVCRVAAIGDSLTDSRSHGGKFLEVLRQRCPRSTFDNFGKGGEMVNQMRRRFTRDVLDSSREPLSHVIIFGGVNDLYSDETAGRTPEKIERDLEWMYNAANERGVKVVAITVSPWGGFTRYFNARRSAATLELNRWIVDQQRLGKTHEVIDSYSLLSCGDPERLCDAYTRPFGDGLHFNAQAHEKLGQQLYEKAFATCL